MSDLIHEVEESIKQERLERLWKEYGVTLITAVVLAVLATAVITGWRSWNDKVSATHTTAIIEALDQTDQVAALEEITNTLRPNHRAISRLTAAGLLLDDGKNEEALVLYREAAADKKARPVFRSLARLMAVRLEWAMQKPDTDPRQLLAALEPLWQENSPWQWHARMQAAIISAHAFNNYDAARAHLGAVAGAENLPGSLKERAKALDHVYAVKMAQAAAALTAKQAKEEPEG